MSPATHKSDRHASTKRPHSRVERRRSCVEWRLKSYIWRIAAPVVALADCRLAIAERSLVQPSAVGHLREEMNGGFPVAQAGVTAGE